jgi:hypothetical protein
MDSVKSTTKLQLDEIASTNATSPSNIMTKEKVEQGYKNHKLSTSMTAKQINSLTSRITSQGG